MTKLNLKKLVATALHSREHANNLVDIINVITTQSNQRIVLEASTGCMNIFTKYLEDSDFSTNSKAETSDEIFKSWMLERFNDCLVACLKLLEVPTGYPQLQEIVLKLLQLKSFCMNKNSTEFVFPENEFEQLLITVLSSENGEMLQELCELLQFDDMRYYVLKAMPTVMNRMFKENDDLLPIVYDFLKTLVTYMPQNGAVLNSSYVFQDKETSSEKFSNSRAFLLSHHRKRFAGAWLEFLKQPLPGSIHKNVLIIFHTSLVPNFAKPRLLADFLMRSYSKGGGLALLGLHGLFVLMHEHNLEYPEFYKNVYAMLHPRIFDAKYKARFFHLLDLFLSSTHIPSYLVAAFVKKMSRLCLTAPPDGICIMVPLILNLVRRHPSIRNLVDCKDHNQEEFSDPFDENASDPSKCAAIDSSLWELDTLKSHYSPQVVKCASFKSIGTLETDIGELLDRNQDEMFAHACSEEFKEFPMSHVKSDSLFGGFEDFTCEIWNVGS